MRGEAGVQRGPWWEVRVGSWNVTVLSGSPINALLTMMMSALQNIKGALSLWLDFFLSFRDLNKIFYNKIFTEGKKKSKNNKSIVSQATVDHSLAVLLRGLLQQAKIIFIFLSQLILLIFHEIVDTSLVPIGVRNSVPFLVGEIEFASVIRALFKSQNSQ